MNLLLASRLTALPQLLVVGALLCAAWACRDQDEALPACAYFPYEAGQALLRVDDGDTSRARLVEDTFEGRRVLVANFDDGTLEYLSCSDGAFLRGVPTGPLTPPTTPPTRLLLEDPTVLNHTWEVAPSVTRTDSVGGAAVTTTVTFRGEIVERGAVVTIQGKRMEDALITEEETTVFLVRGRDTLATPTTFTRWYVPGEGLVRSGTSTSPRTIETLIER